MRSITVAAVVAALTLGAAGCGSTTSSPTNPTDTPPEGAMVIDVVSENGAQSFRPNPATVPAGQMVVWHNIDRQTHRVVLNDGQLDTGNIAPGAFSAPMTLSPAGPYHCSIHPDMVGTLVANQ